MHGGCVRREGEKRERKRATHLVCVAVGVDVLQQLDLVQRLVEKILTVLDHLHIVTKRDVT